MGKQGKLGLGGILLATVLSAIGCVSNHVNTGIGAIFPGNAKEKNLPTLTVGELGYIARSKNSSWGVGASYQHGIGYESSSGNPSANEPAYNSSLKTTTGTVYGEYIFGNDTKKLCLRAGLKRGRQNLTTSVKEPINQTFYESDVVNGVSLAVTSEFWSKEGIAASVQLEQSFYDSDNITNTTTLSTGVTIIFDK